MPASAPVPDEDAGMRRTYALVILCHAAVISALWLFGRIFSS